MFDAGLRQAELQIAKAQFTEAAENYRATVLRAMKEVQDELSSLRWLAQEYNETTTAATAARKAADLSLTLYRDGASSYLDVVTAQSTALEAERLAIVLHTRQLVADIGLMLALGGGWTVPPEPPRNRLCALSRGIAREALLCAMKRHARRASPRRHNELCSAIAQ